MDQRGGLSEGGLEKDLFVHQFPKDDDGGDNIAITSDIVNDDYSDIDDDFPLHLKIQPLISSAKLTASLRTCAFYLFTQYISYIIFHMLYDMHHNLRLKTLHLFSIPPVPLCLFL